MRAALAAQADVQGDIVIECDRSGRLTGWASAGVLALQVGLPASGFLEIGGDPAQVLPAPLGVAFRAILAGQQVPMVAVPLSGVTEHFRLAEIPLSGWGPRYVSLRRLTGHVEVEDRLTRREALLKDLFDLSPVGVLLINYKTGEILEANAALLGFGGWARSDVIGHHFDSLLPKADVCEVVAEMAATGQFGPIEKLFRRPDGSQFEAVVRGLKVGPKGNRRVWVLVEDVSMARAHVDQLRRARDEALRLRAELHLAVEALPHGFVMFDAEDRTVLINSQMHRRYPEIAEHMILGRRYEDVLRHAIAAKVLPEANGQEEDFVQTFLAARKKEYFERLIQTSSGRKIRVIERRTPDGGRVGLRIDVTEELAVQEHLSQVIEGARVGTWELDLQTLGTQVNERWAAMLGHRPEDLGVLGSCSVLALVHPDDRAMNVATISAILAGERETLDQVFRMRHADGHWVWIESRGKVSRKAPDGRPLTMAGVNIDVSAMKTAELRLAGIIHGAEAGIWEFDTRANLNRVNDRWAEMLGYSVAELTPLTAAAWQDMLHPEDLARVLALEQEAFAQGNWTYSYELRLRHRAGHWVWVQSRGRVTDWDENGRPVAMSGVHLDISARMQLEMTLEKERDFLATLMETSVSGIMALDDKGVIIFANREIEAIFEMPNAALLGQVCDPVAFRLFDDAGYPMLFDLMPCQRALLSGQTLRDIRLRLRTEDGREKVVSVNAAPLPDPQGEPRVVCTVTDITKAAEAEDHLREATLRAEASNLAKSQFLANVSHELRTPLNGILGMAEMMQTARPGDDQAGMLQAIRESGAHLLSVVNDILDLAKVESGKLALEPGPLSLPDLAARVDAMHRVTAMAKGLRLDVSLEDGLTSARFGDARRVLQVLHNLVGNAIKFTEMGKVSLSFGALGPDQVLITVADSGIGMSPAQSASVWEEFTQADGSITRRFGGTGLGLPIVRRLVELMAGKITLDSTIGLGTRVCVTLPLPPLWAGEIAPEAEVHAAPAVQHVTGAEHDTEAKENIGAPEVVAQFKGLRALVAEDNGTNRMILRAMLSHLGIEAVMVEDGDQVADALALGDVDVMLLDISMPRKDGVSALQEVVSRAGTRPVPPAIAVTANAMTHHVDDYLRAGFAAVVCKPVGLMALAEVIGDLCTGKAAVGEERIGQRSSP